LSIVASLMQSKCVCKRWTNCHLEADNLIFLISGSLRSLLYA
jgi:hypothetical protein